MHKPKPTPPRPRPTWSMGLLAFLVALATFASPSAAVARGLSAGMPVPVGPTTKASGASGPLRIEVEPTIDDASLLTQWVLERAGGVANGIPLVEGHEQWIAVRIGGATYDYRVSVTPMRGGVPLAAVKAPEVCECNSEALLALLDDRIVAAVEAMRVAPSPTASAPVPMAVEPTPEVAKADGTRATDALDRRLRLHTIGYVGVGAIVLGTGLLAAGIPLARRPDEIRGGMGQIETRSPRETGIGLAVSGSVAVAVGVSMVVIDLVRSRSRVVAMVPVVGPRQLGVGLTWRARGRVGQ